MTAPCSCSNCRGALALAPSPNLPGRDALALRAGTHATFLAAMLQAMSSADHRTGLAGLFARASTDPSIATLDGWATIADVLTFYQERFGNEGYLRTARDPRSLAELARLIGYEARPGVSASVQLAYSVDDSDAKVVIRAGTRAQSVPGGPGEQAQTFETSSALEARKAWNNLQVRLSRPQRIAIVDEELRIEEDDKYAIFLQGATSQLKPNDKLLFVAAKTAVVKTIASVTPEPALGRTRIGLLAPETDPVVQKPLPKGTPLVALFAKLLASTSKLPPARPNIARRASSDLSDPKGDAAMRLLSAMQPEAANAAFKALESAEVTAPLEISVHAMQRVTLFGANAPKSRAPLPPVYRGEGFQILSPLEVEWKMPRIWAGGEVLPAEPVPEDGGGEISLRGAKSPKKRGRKTAPPKAERDSGAPPPPIHPDASAVILDGAFDTLKIGSWLMLQTQQTMLTKADEKVVQVDDVRIAPRAEFGLSGKTTRASLSADGAPHTWLVGEPVAEWDYDVNGRPAKDEPGGEPGEKSGYRFDAFRRTVVYLPVAPLALTEVPNETSVPAAEARDVIELNAVYSGIEPDRWVIFSGERADVEATFDAPDETTPGDGDGEGDLGPGERGSNVPPPPDPLPTTIKAADVRQAELARVLAVRHDFEPSRPGDRVRSSLILEAPLSFSFKRDTLRIYGNVVDATHGETRKEVLGGGDATLPNQSFALRQPPLTYVAAATMTGVESTLEITVNGARYREVAALSDAGPSDRVYTLRSDEAGKTTVTFGDGVNGARLPSGRENVTARYRSGLGSAGNVKASQISTPLDKPQGVREVTNPLRASGGADRDRATAVRRNAPASVRALDRLVSIADYADFALTFAGIGKASAQKLSDGVRDVVHVTIAGIDDVPILTSSDLFRSFEQALKRFGDPQLPIQVALRRAYFLLIDATLELTGEYAWEAVQPRVVSVLRERFSFEQLELGSPIHPSQVLAAIHSVPGVKSAELAPLQAIASDSDSFTEAESGVPIADLDVQLARTLRSGGPPWPIIPASIAYLSPTVPEGVSIQEKKS